MKPYYDDGQCVIYHENSATLIRAVSGKADVVITDPPYGFGAYETDIIPPEDFLGDLLTARTTAVFGYPETLVAWCLRGKVVPSEWVTWWPTNAIVGRAKRLNREVECIAIFGEVDASHLIEPRSVDSQRIAQTYDSAKNKTHRKAGDLWRDAKPGMAFNYHLRQHPNEKPLSLMTKLVKLCSRPGDVILDPFMGSGTTLRAAKDLSRKAIGIEIEERYCAVAAERLGQEVLDLGMAA